MTAQEFCYWLNGFAELTTEPPTAEQWRSIKEHLALSFNKVTPNLINTPRAGFQAHGPIVDAFGQYKAQTPPNIRALDVRC